MYLVDDNIQSEPTERSLHISVVEWLRCNERGFVVDPQINWLTLRCLSIWSPGRRAGFTCYSPFEGDTKNA